MKICERITLKPGEMIAAGGVRIHNHGAALIVGIGARHSIIARPVGGGDYELDTYRMPGAERMTVEKSASVLPALPGEKGSTGLRGRTPLVKLGPGGEFSHDWPKEDPQG